ncbi:MAG: hypothetical protein KIT34_08640 [Cyanobacteria bacterium TGS_CYA1]|nr:hypothetical protein [Cyanobacteria bacterium TGS_CYA1]
MFHLKSLLHPRIQVGSTGLSINLGGDTRTKACICFERLDELTDARNELLSICKISQSKYLGPKGKRQEDLLLVGVFDFRSIPEIGGYLHLYLSSQYRDYQPKERGWNLVTLESHPLVGGFQGNKLSAKLAVDPDSHPIVSNYTEKPGTLLFHGAKPGEALNIAAFHANGISYSEARARDPHFSHLLESARNWFVLFAFREKELLDQETSRILYVCMTEDDFSNKAFGKCQLVFV